ncbi:PEGA domain-containing protein [Methanoculleus sp. FWC-SCC1]|uniref:PEGA domain-containing protein n=1 Tax=Methanoculleus frigidifontis TaxID=2584085 RepID=A0ABT8M955_9EURY|nr:PEGA domain-containing protein [Methanoculleus sp. FWC-SCC1]MDN7024474.1 PEGA domain-containing protein [Methanoculleus sp. FWC-SCC1]
MKKTTACPIIGLALLVLIAGIPSAAAGIGGDEGWYTFHCNVNGASVYIDGEYKGQIAQGVLSVPVYTTGTPYQAYRVEMPGYQSVANSLPGSPAAGETVDVYVTLNPLATTGSISATSTPSGAAIYVNGNYRGITPLTISDLSPGSYQMEADMPGYQPYQTTVSVTSGKTTSVLFPLQAISQPGSIVINSNPSGAYVYMDATYKGKTPLTLSGVSAKSHNIELDLNGYYDWKTTVSVSPGVTSYVNAQMHPIPDQNPGYISVTSSPSGASVSVDGVYKGQTSDGQALVVGSLTAGSHTVTLSLSGYQDYSTSVSVQSGVTTPVSVAMTPLPPGPTGSISVSSSPSGANVYLDDAYKGITPLTLTGVATGSHVVAVKVSGYQDWSDAVQVNAGSTSYVSASLNPISTPTQAGALPFAALGALAVFGLILAVRKRM